VGPDQGVQLAATNGGGVCALFDVAAVRPALERPPRVIEGVDPAKRLAEDIAKEIDRLGALADQVAALIGEAKQQAAGEIVPLAVAEVSRSIDRLVLQRHRFLLAGFGLALVLALGAGVGLDRWVLPSGSVPVAARCAPHPAGQPFTCTMQMRSD
jgi:hypothetical protein